MCDEKLINMIDPSDALRSFQNKLSQIPLESGRIYPDLYVYADQPQGIVRLTYVRLENKIVTAFVNFVQCAPINKIPCFQIGYAVPEPYRNRGLATKTILMAISEMREGFKQTRLSTFYIEAIVEADNKQSQRVAEKAISAKPTAIVDEISGVPAFQYLCRIKVMQPISSNRR